MINFKLVNKYCKDDIALIENYEKAANDKTQTWDCHHRLETDLVLSADELMKQNKYLNVPASELIFLTRTDHTRLHNIGRQQSEESNRKRSDANKGKKNPNYANHGEKNGMYGKHPKWMNNGIVCVFPKTQEEIEYYLELGYHFGRKLK